MSLLDEHDLVTAGPGGTGGDLLNRKRCSMCQKLRHRTREFYRSAREGDELGRGRTCIHCFKGFEDNRRSAVPTARIPRSPRDRYPDIPSRPKVPGKLTDEQLLTLIFRDSGGGYIHTAELAYKTGVAGPLKLAEQTERLRLAGLVRMGDPAEFTVTPKGLAHLRKSGGARA
jgi:hypothetical protein